jgi:hypothetical protein
MTPHWQATFSEPQPVGQYPPGWGYGRLNTTLCRDTFSAPWGAQKS